MSILVGVGVFLVHCILISEDVLCCDVLELVSDVDLWSRPPDNDPPFCDMLRSLRDELLSVG